MDVSRHVPRVVTCPAGHAFTATVWDIVDLEQHHRLRTDHAELHRMRCAVCDAPTELDTPLLLVNALGGIRVISIGGWADDDAAGRARTARALDQPEPPPPGMLITTTRRMLDAILASADADDLRGRIRTGAAGNAEAEAGELAHALDVQHIARLALLALTSLDQDMPAADLARTVSDSVCSTTCRFATTCGTSCCPRKTTRSTGAF